MPAKNVVFVRLSALPPEHVYWRNKWMFTRPVFVSESRQMNDSVAFWLWVSSLPTALQKYIDQAPCAE